MGCVQVALGYLWVTLGHVWASQTFLLISQQLSVYFRVLVGYLMYF